MKVLIFGATGMVGMGALLECLDDERVERVLLVSRHPIDVSHPKVLEILHKDFFDFSAVRSQFADLDACFFCLGVSSVGMNERDYRHLTYDLTLVAATAIASVTAQRLTFCYVSGEGTDSTERGRAAWARIKGQTENALLRLPFKTAFMFRPGYIQPLRGIRTDPALGRHQSAGGVVGRPPLRAWIATVGILALLLPTREDQIRDGVPGVVNADEEQKQRGCCDAEKGCLDVRASCVRCRENSICDGWEQNVKQPLLEHRLVLGLFVRAPSHDTGVPEPRHAAEATEECRRANAAPRGAENR